MKLLHILLFVTLSASVMAQRPTGGDGSKENPYTGQGPGEPLAAHVIYEEIFLESREKRAVTGKWVEARMKSLVKGKKGDAEYETTMGHQFAMLASLCEGQGQMRLAVDLGAVALEHYQSAEQGMERASRPARERARIAAHMGELQEQYLSDRASAKMSYAKALRLDPNHEKAKKSEGRLARDERVKEKPRRDGTGG